MNKVVLDNGFEIYTDQIESAKTVTFSIYVKAGSYQEKEPFGAAHFLEHMVFKGTPTRDTMKIMEDVEDFGGFINAETSFNHTRYYVTMPQEYWKNGADVICDIVLNPTFPENEFVLEKKVIQEELKMYSDTPDSYVADLLMQEMFASYPERQTLGGTVQDVEAITREELIEFKNTFYQPNNMFAVVSGSISNDEVVEFLTSIFDQIENKTPIEELQDKKFTPDILDSKTITKNKNVEQSHLMWGLFVAPETDKDSYALKVASSILGGSSSSRLYRLIREQRGLCYTVSVGYMSMKDVAMIEGYAGLESSSIDEVKDIVVEQFELLRTELVSDAELKRAIAYYKGRQAMKFDNLSSINGFIGGSVIRGVSADPEDQLKNIESVTKEDIQRVARQYFTPDNWQFAELRPN